MRLAFLLCAKDLRLYLRDRGALAMSLALPILLVLVFGGAMGAIGGGDSIGRVTLIVTDLDHGAAARELVDALGQTKGLEVVERADGRERVANGKAPAALVIEQGFERRPTDGLRLLRDPGQIIEQQIIAGNLVAVLLKSGGEPRGRQLAYSSLGLFGVPASMHEPARRVLDEAFAGMAALMLQAALRPPPAPEPGPAAESKPEPRADFEFGRELPHWLGVATEDIAGTPGQEQKVAQQAHAVAGIAVMMLLFGLTAAGGTVLEERDEGTLERLALIRHAGSAVLTGKLLFVLASGLLQLVIMFSFGALVFAVPVWRAPLALVATSLCVALACTGFGLLLAVTCSSRKQLEGLSTIAILVMSALGGSWFPLAIVPEWFRKIGHFTLNAWAMDAYQGIFWYGKALADLWLELGMLLGIAAAALSLSYWIWQRRGGIARR